MVRRTSILIDDALLEAAQRALGTTGITPTIEAALRAAVRAQRRQQLLARLRDPDGFDDDAMVVARQWRT